MDRSGVGRDRSERVSSMQLILKQIQDVEFTESTDSETPRAIEDDDFPFVQLSRIAERESWRKEINRPIYHIHKWWARRLGSVFRGILLGALTPKGTDIMHDFYSSVRFPEKVVFDPFMGSGTTVGETLKLGARAIGRDINPVSYLQVRTALTLKDSKDLMKVYREIEEDVAGNISEYYESSLADGTQARVLYYFWVMQVPCPVCFIPVDLFSSYIFAKHAYPSRNPRVQVVCPKCGEITTGNYRVPRTTCSGCNYTFNATQGPVKSRVAECPHCTKKFAIGRTILDSGAPPQYRMYAKLILTQEGYKQYHRINEYDEYLYRKAATELEVSPYRIPDVEIQPGYNTNQVLSYGIASWRQIFNARQLLCISTLADRIRQIDDPSLRETFTCLFSGVLEFNNMFASYKGEGTGAVRHMYSHHILKPERTPLEANVWGTPRSSGAFSTLFRTRLLRAADYARQPFELAVLPEESGSRSAKIINISEPLTGLSNSESFEQFQENSRLYVSCGDSSLTDLESGCVDIVITDPPFFDNVHYSELADFFYAWQRLILEDYPSHLAATTRSNSEVQNSDPTKFTERLMSVMRESARVLKPNGLLVFTYHHSRWEGWSSVLHAVAAAGFKMEYCHPVKAEMSVASPKQKAREPINFDIIIVCRIRHNVAPEGKSAEIPNLCEAFRRAEAQIMKLRASRWKLSRNDIAVIVMAQAVAEVSRKGEIAGSGEVFDRIKDPIIQAIDRIHDSSRTPAQTKRQ